MEAKQPQRLYDRAREALARRRQQVEGQPSGEEDRFLVSLRRTQNVEEVQRVLMLYRDQAFLRRQCNLLNLKALDY